jgi:hypothetical protein
MPSASNTCPAQVGTARTIPPLRGRYDANRALVCSRMLIEAKSSTSPVLMMFPRIMSHTYVVPGVLRSAPTRANPLRYNPLHSVTVMGSASDAGMVDWALTKR